MGGVAMKSNAEIAAEAKRLDEGSEDFFGFRREVLIGALPFDLARPWLKDDATPEEWSPLLNEEDRITGAREYLDFAWGKARDHRGISAGRSIQKMATWAWILGNEDLAGADDRDDYAMYGAPILADFSRWLGVPIPEGEDIARMVEGLPCGPDCEGCRS